MKPFALDLDVCKSYPQLRLRHSVSKYTYVQLLYLYSNIHGVHNIDNIMVGHLYTDIPMTNVQVSVTRIMLWRVFLFRVFLLNDVGPNSSKTHLLTGCMILDLKILMLGKKHITTAALVPTKT